MLRVDLFLADIITYGCEKYKPKIVIDFATLTGAIMVALGQHYAGLFCNDDKLADTLYQSGQDTNEKVWRMPFMMILIKNLTHHLLI